MQHEPDASRHVPDRLPGFIANPEGPVSVFVAKDEKGGRHAYLTPSVSARGRRRVLTQHQGIVVSDLQHLAIESQLLEGKVRAAVHHARVLGVSWALVGFSVGLSDVGARKRFGEPHDVVMHVEQGS